MAQKPFETVVLNSMVAAAGNSVLAGGKYMIVDAASVPLMSKFRIADGLSYSKTAYAAGTASIKTYNLTGISLAAGTIYRLTVDIQGRVDFASGGGKESNALFTLRDYEVSSGSSISTADEIKSAFITRINADPQAGVTASSGGVGILTLTLNDVNTGDFTVPESPAGTVDGISTAFVAPSGTYDIVKKYAPLSASPTGNYTTWTINYNRQYRSAAVSGSILGTPVFIYIFAEETDANFAAFAAEVDAVLAGTHTPVADYLGI